VRFAASVNSTRQDNAIIILGSDLDHLVNTFAPQEDDN
jgi:hypothetical protein